MSFFRISITFYPNYVFEFNFLFFAPSNIEVNNWHSSFSFNSWYRRLILIVIFFFFILIGKRALIGCSKAYSGEITSFFNTLFVKFFIFCHLDLIDKRVQSLKTIIKANI